MRSRRASYIEGVSERQGEQEVLHPHGAKYRVTAVHDHVRYPTPTYEPVPRERRTYVLEEIDERDLPTIPPSRRTAEFDWDEARVHRGEHGRFGPGTPAGTSAETDERKRQAEAVAAHPLFCAYGPTDLRPLLSADELPRPIQNAARHWCEELPGAQYQALEDYTGEGSPVVNRPLRKCPDTLDCLDDDTLIAATRISDALASAPELVAPMTSWRGVHCSRDEDLATLESSLHAAHATGGTLSMPGFGSASINPSVAANVGDIVLEIRSRRVAYVASLSQHPDEFEVLHPHQALYRVTGVHEYAPFVAGDGTVTPLHKRTYVLEEVGETPALPRRLSEDQRWQNISDKIEAMEKISKPPHPGGDDVPFGLPSGVLGRIARFGWDPAKVVRGPDGRFGTGGATSAVAAPVAAPTDVVDLSGVPGIEHNPLFVDYGDGGRPPIGIEQWPKPILEKVTAWLGGLDPAQGKAIGLYTNFDYGELNHALRKPDFSAADVTASARRIQDALLSAPLLDRPMTSWRGLDMNPVKLAALEASLRTAHATGDAVTMTGFGSATSNPQQAGDWGAHDKKAILEIRSRRASFIEGVTFCHDELEVLHPHGARYKVTAVHDAATYPSAWGRRRVCTYVLEEIDEASVPKLPGEPAASEPAAKFDWDESHAHRGEHGRFGTAAASVASVAPTDATADAASGAFARSRFEACAAAGLGASGLPPERTGFFRNCLRRALDGMPPAALGRVAAHVETVHFYPDPTALSLAALADVPGQTDEEATQRAEYRAMVVGRTWSAAGAYGPDDKGLYLDGRPTVADGLMVRIRQKKDPDYVHDCARESVSVYAHELSHAIDGPAFEISGSPDWDAAWRREIKLQDAEALPGDPPGTRRTYTPLTGYADTNPQEGLAEFGMFLYTRTRPPADMKRDFPRCAAIFERYGLWPKD